MHKVTIQASGQTFDVAPSQTVLEAAVAAGINLPYGCRNGMCGSCKGKVIAGKVEHGEYFDNAMTQDELANGHALFCSARPLEDLVIDSLVDSNIDGVKPKILPARILKKEQLADDVMVLHLQLPSSEALQFRAGQYIEFILKDGQRRAFSIANAPFSEASIELHLRLVKDGEFTPQVFNELKEKAIMRIEAPFGNFYLREDSKTPIIFAATGTGFAPIKAIIEHMLYSGIERSMTLYWGARTFDGLYMDDLCQRWAANVPNFTYVPMLSKPDANWQGKTGYVQDVVTADIDDLSGHQAYVCGLPQMVDDAQQAFRAARLSEDAFFSDAFTFAPRVA